MTTLYRANAYRLQRFDIPVDQRQPEVHVFVEARTESEAGSLILRCLASLWACSTADIEFHSLQSEGTLLGPLGIGPADMGDAGLLVTGWFHGPLFCKPEHTLILTSPRTLERLHRARQVANTWQRRQREAARLAANAGRAPETSPQFLPDLANLAAAVRQAEASFGASC